jgi:hypothetical protein
MMFANLNRRYTASANADSLVELEQQWHKIDRAIVAAANAGENVDELCNRVDEIEKRIAAIVPATMRGIIVQARLLKSRWGIKPSEVDDRLLENMLAGLESMAVGAGTREPMLA